jgi:ornithine cyclodeaminase/alanine dehydrogenase-like protein (mu-crystallin family)
VVTDSRDQCARLGELQHAMGMIDAGSVAEIGEICAGTRPGRTFEDQVTVCDLTGIGVQDVAAASAVMERAAERGLGERIGL